MSFVRTVNPNGGVNMLKMLEMLGLDNHRGAV